MKRWHLRPRIRSTLRYAAYPLILPKIKYGDDFEVRKARKEGDIKWQGAHIFISELLRHECVGLREIEDDLFEVCFGATILGEIDCYRKTSSDAVNLRTAFL